jgi:hypothetical protein
MAALGTLPGCSRYRSRPSARRAAPSLAGLRDTLQVLYQLQVKADCQAQAVTERQARRAGMRANQLLQSVSARLGTGDQI